jgi:hypothetical protein
MEIVWYGLGCFRLVERGCPAVVTDPFVESETGLRLPRLRAGLVTCSELVEEPQELQWPDLLEVERTVAGPGEYEIGGVFITGVTSPGVPKQGVPFTRNIIYTISYDGVTVCHLGNPGEVPTQALVETIGRVDVLLVPVGVPGGLTVGKISETVSLIEPDVVIPMQYWIPGLKIEREPIDAFLKEMGVTDSTPVASLKVIPGAESEETQIVLLEPQQALPTLS